MSVHIIRCFSIFTDELLETITFTNTLVKTALFPKLQLLIAHSADQMVIFDFSSSTMKWIS